MSTIDINNKKQLEQGLVRAFDFINAISADGKIREQLTAKGYTEHDHAEGLRLVAAVIDAKGESFDTSTSHAATDAIQELAKWNTTEMRRLRAALDHLHPMQEQFVFHGLDEASGIEGVVVVATILNRIDALESSEARAATRDADKKALDTIAARGFDKKERDRLRAVIKVAEAGAQAPVADVSTLDRLAKLEAVRAWYVDWAETARTIFKRRADLIRLGLARPQKRVSKKTAATAPAATPAPIPTSGGSSTAGSHAPPIITPVVAPSIMPMPPAPSMPMLPAAPSSNGMSSNGGGPA